MISIYNETKTPWGLKVIDNKVNCFFKEKTYTKKDENLTKKIKNSIHILAYSTLFENQPDMTKLVSMSKPEVISDKNTTIIFSKKDFNPFITEKAEPVKDIVLISIPLYGRKVVNISNENIFILEGFILSGELNLIASINDTSKKLGITLFDGKSFNNYEFANTDGTITVTKSTTEADEEILNKNSTKPFKLKTFRPAKPTHTILVYKQDIEKLQSVVDFNKHNVVEITNKTADEVLTGLLNENYKAVTVYVDSNTFAQTEQKIYGNLIQKLFNISVDKKRFKIVNLLLNNKQIIKRKKF